MKNIIYRRKIIKMYYCYAGNKKAGDYFSCQMRNILMIFSFSATEKPRNTLSTSSFNWRSFFIQRRKISSRIQNRVHGYVTKL